MKNVSERSVKSNCNVGLLITATQAAYRIKKGNLIDPEYAESYAETLNNISNHGYQIADAITPKGSGGSGSTPLAALCLTPQDSQSPIIISFRGTKTFGDVLSDIRLGATGVVQPMFRDAAFQFYQKIRREYPDREIVLTGHSLGGHLAQYVAAKAYNTDADLLSKRLIQVRTFNTAPTDTEHSAIFQKNTGLLAQFVNYRVSSDVVSDLPIQNYYGNMFALLCPEGALAAHPMSAVNKYLPDVIKDQIVGTSPDFSKIHNLLVEQVHGVLNSYQCRVDGQYFSRFRAGAVNLQKMKDGLPWIMDAIHNKDYDHAVVELGKLKGSLNGEISKDIIDTLIHSTQAVAKNAAIAHQSQQTEIVKKPQGESIKIQVGMKEELKSGRQVVEAENTSSKNVDDSSSLEGRSMGSISVK